MVEIVKRGFDPKNREVCLLSESTINVGDEGEEVSIVDFMVEKKATGFISKSYKSKGGANKIFKQQLLSSNNL